MSGWVRIALECLTCVWGWRLPCCGEEVQAAAMRFCAGSLLCGVCRYACGGYFITHAHHVLCVARGVPPTPTGVSGAQGVFSVRGPVMPASCTLLQCAVLTSGQEGRGGGDSSLPLQRTSSNARAHPWACWV